MRKTSSIVVTAALASALTLAMPAGAVTSHHYDTDTIPVSSISVGTATCTGGGLTLVSSWRNRIDATQSNCRAYHYDLPSYVTLLEITPKNAYTTLPAADRNRTESLKYFS